MCLGIDSFIKSQPNRDNSILSQMLRVISGRQVTSIQPNRTAAKQLFLIPKVESFYDVQRFTGSETANSITYKDTHTDIVRAHAMALCEVVGMWQLDIMCTHSTRF